MPVMAGDRNVVSLLDFPVEPTGSGRTLLQGVTKNAFDTRI
jgi:hypothetical protein